MEKEVVRQNAFQAEGRANAEGRWPESLIQRVYMRVGRVHEMNGKSLVP